MFGNNAGLLCEENLPRLGQPEKFNLRNKERLQFGSPRSQRKMMTLHGQTCDSYLPDRVLKMNSRLRSAEESKHSWAGLKRCYQCKSLTHPFAVFGVHCLSPTQHYHQSSHGARTDPPRQLRPLGRA